MLGLILLILVGGSFAAPGKFTHEDFLLGFFVFSFKQDDVFFYNIEFFTVPTSDVDVLQFALTVENLASSFYTRSLDKYPRQLFLDAGVKPADYDQIVRVRDNEGQLPQRHKSALESLLLSSILLNDFSKTINST